MFVSGEAGRDEVEEVCVCCWYVYIYIFREEQCEGASPAPPSTHANPQSRSTDYRKLQSRLLTKWKTIPIEGGERGDSVRDAGLRHARDGRDVTRADSVELDPAHAGALHDARQLALVAHDACDPAQAYCAPKATCVSINTAALVAYDA